MILWAVVGDPCSLLPLQAVASVPITPTSLEALPVPSLTLGLLLWVLCLWPLHVLCCEATVSPLWAWDKMWQPGKGHAVGPGKPLECAHPSRQASLPSKAPCDLQAVQGAGCDPLGSTVPARGLGFIQEGQRDMARKWSNPSPAAGRARVTKANGAGPAERSRHGDPRSPFKVPEEDEGMWQHPLGMVPHPLPPAETVLSEQWWQHHGAQNSAPCCGVQGLIPAARAD